MKKYIKIIPVLFLMMFVLNFAENANSEIIKVDDKKYPII